MEPLPYPEDIYDFGEMQLTETLDRVSSALESYQEGENEKWYFKAVQVAELIEIELEERISIG
jgi:hypothetical protein